MARPSVDPASICLKVEPGDADIAVVSIAKAPSAASVTAVVIDGNSLITIRRLRSFRVVRRPFTEEEINDLPPFPPSIREQARRNGTVENEEVGSSDGSTPLAVSTGFPIEIEVEFAAPTQQAPDVTIATLRIEGTGWDRVDVPLVMLIGKGTFTPSVEPPASRRALEPGEVATEGFGFLDVKSTGKIMAFVVGGAGIIRLGRLTIRRAIARKFTDEEIAELPPYPPSVRDNARKSGYFEYQVVRTGGSCAPLEISKGMAVAGEVEFAAPAQEPPELLSATLVIEGTTWRRAEVPVFLIIGKIEVTISADTVSLHQGESADVSVTVRSVMGPATDVDIALGMDSGVWRIAPGRIRVARGATVSVTARVTADPCAPVGSFPVGLEVLSFEGLQFRRIPFQLEVRPGDIVVESLQASLTVDQGITGLCALKVTSQGYKRLTLSVLALPEGVTLQAPPREIGCARQTTVVHFNLLTDLTTPPVKDARVALRWSAGDDEHNGIVEMLFTVEPKFEERTFTGQITTPPGTALGGWASITIRKDGTYTFSGHMHDSGFDPYSFRIGVTVRSPAETGFPGGFISIAAHKSGEVAGTLGSGSRDYDWKEDGESRLIRLFWFEVRNGSASFTKSYEDTGVLGTLEDIVTAVGDYLVLGVFLSPIAGVAAPGIAAAIVIGSELGALPGIVGAIMTIGNAPYLLLLGPGVFIPVVVADAVAAIPRKRRLTAAEVAEADQVFGGTLPVDRIRITDLTNFMTAKDRAFTLPGLDGIIQIGVGDRFNDMLSGANSATLIHELTHAWQMEHAPFAVEHYFKVVIDWIRGSAAYVYRPVGREWSSYSPEAQAQLVQEWYADFKGRLNSTEALKDDRFPYIQNNIRLGQP